MPAVWYAIQTKRYSEGRVSLSLTRSLIPAVLPLIEVSHRARGRRRVSLEPLFPCYLFAQMERIDDDPGLWHSLRWTPGVRSILGADGEPTPVPDEVIGALQERVKDLGFVRPGLRFAANDRVLIRHGPLSGLEAVFDRPLSGSGRVQVLVQMLQRQSRVQIDERDLEPV